MQRGTCTFMDLTSAVNRHHNTQTNFPDNEKCTRPSLMFAIDDDASWELIQFHFHDGSEHTLDGVRFDAEVHLVHQSDNGNLLVVGIMLDGNDQDDDADDDSYDASEILEPLLQSYEIIASNVVSACNSGGDSEHANTASHDSLAISDIPEDWSPYDFVPNANDFAIGAYFYTGSLTTPPCSTGVTWYVLDTPLSVSSDQISRLKNTIVAEPAWPSCTLEIPKDYEGTYRPTQSVGSRQVVHFCNA